MTSKKAFTYFVSYQIYKSGKYQFRSDICELTSELVTEQDLNRLLFDLQQTEELEQGETIFLLSFSLMSINEGALN